MEEKNNESQLKRFKVTMVHTIYNPQDKVVGDVEQSTVELSWEEAFLCCGKFEFGESYKTAQDLFVTEYLLFMEQQRKLQALLPVAPCYPQTKAIIMLFNDALQDQGCIWDQKQKKITGLQFRIPSITKLLPITDTTLSQLPLSHTNATATPTSPNAANAAPRLPAITTFIVPADVIEPALPQEEYVNVIVWDHGKRPSSATYIVPWNLVCATIRLKLTSYAMCFLIPKRNHRNLEQDLVHSWVKKTLGDKAVICVYDSLQSKTKAKSSIQETSFLFKHCIVINEHV